MIENENPMQLSYIRNIVLSYVKPWPIFFGRAGTLVSCEVFWLNKDDKIHGTGNRKIKAEFLGFWKIEEWKIRLVWRKKLNHVLEDIR